MKVAFFKGTKKGLAGFYNQMVRIVTKGKYSHCEVIFNDKMSASASFMDGGVRFKKIEYSSDNWDFIELPDSLEKFALEWFKEHDGEDYDLFGNLHFIIPLFGDEKHKWCCSEACATALGIRDAWRFHPNSLNAILKTMYVK